ncbi:CBS domain protein [Rhodovulum imhoffii]|uniref:CBS domain protein n=1 Tax=Rhodovulum imhoffii TaxID=365340 RepID=A0A2T5BVT0_9RHOB|nr:CBS domain-containing protein [Rhodovulum imhoffii]MBK5933244.1 histidine kinase [Rhodovulum imhoffii]PTN03655.1 CBS domain protein [Rhodovulum imhoffii]
MQVFQILKSKADDRVITVSPGSSVAAAAKLLSVRRIGSVVVSPDGAMPVGIVSERDIVRELGKSGDACLKYRVEAVMTRDVITCTKDQSAEEILETMTRGRFRHIPVMEDGRMVGLISIGDVVKARISELAMEKSALEGMVMGN